MKRVLKFVIESLVVVFIIYSVFSAGRYVKSKKDVNNKQQETSQQTQNNNTNNNNDNQTGKNQEKRKLSQVELDNAMNNVVEKYKGNNEISIIYKNFSTGYRFAVEDDHYFTAASTVKVVYAMKIYDRISAGEITKNTEIAYNSKFLEAGGGEITNQQKKSSYPLDYVIQNMIQYSDNTATRMLVGNSATAADVLTKYFAQLGITLPLAEAQKNRVTPKMMEEVWTKLYNEREKYPDLIKYLEDSEDNEWIKEGITGKKIASKYGGIDANMHDTAIVFGDEDYMLLIYTNNLRNSGESITQIAKEIDNLTENNM
ncbi:serine hydrolase [Gemella cuniculi]|uniref:serine hydrolase n=1 Tax=Gemella cuniculi TaxID=150240 RepID=UPI000554F884|nr:serine hydrolase [Gemella cuniculi]